MKDLHSPPKNKYLVSWIIWNRDLPQWKPIYKFQRCKTEDKAKRMKQNLMKQTMFIEVYISHLI